MHIIVCLFSYLLKYKDFLLLFLLLKWLVRLIPLHVIKVYITISYSYHKGRSVKNMLFYTDIGMLTFWSHTKYSLLYGISMTKQFSWSIKLLCKLFMILNEVSLEINHLCVWKRRKVRHWDIVYIDSALLCWYQMFLSPLWHFPFEWIIPFVVSMESLTCICPMCVHCFDILSFSGTCEKFTPWM